MRVKREKSSRGEVDLPEELFVQPQLLETLARNQDSGLVYYGECVYPPWKRQRKSGSHTNKKLLAAGSLKSSASASSGKQANKYRVETTSKKKPFTDQENMFIVAERNRGTTWEKIASMMLDRTASQVKKHFHANLKPKRKYNKQKVKESHSTISKNKQTTQPQATTAAVQRSQAPVGTSTGQLLPNQPPVMVQVTQAELENKMYNKILSVPKKMDKSGKRPQLYFVLNFNELEDKCHLVPLMEDGKFVSGKKKYKLVPEGEGEELEGVQATTCTVVKSVATNKVQDADQEAWAILDDMYDVTPLKL
jgi:hypothetical protein